MNETYANTLIKIKMIFTKRIIYFIMIYYYKLLVVYPDD